MKNQTYILYIENATGVMKDFYRFSYKKAGTVKEKFLNEVLKNKDYWINTWTADGGKYARLYATPDGYNKLNEYEWSIDIKTI